jgi:hypothetical protein
MISNSGCYTVDGLERLINKENSSLNSLIEKKDDPKLIIELFSSNNYLDSNEFSLYLFSHVNSIINYNYVDTIHQDMKRPLCNYWIASSHNT